MGFSAATTSFLTSLGGGLAAAAIGGSLFSKPAAQAPAAAAAAVPAPDVTPPTPIPDQKAVEAATKQRSIVAQQQRMGRASTILTDQSVSAKDPLGGT